MEIILMKFTHMLAANMLALTLVSCVPHATAAKRSFSEMDNADDKGKKRVKLDDDATTTTPLQLSNLASNAP